MPDRTTRSILLAIGWTCAILLACSRPGKDLPDIDFELFEVDKLAHFTFFLIFGWLWARALPGTFRAGFACIGLAGISFGIAIEIYQGLLPFDRTPDPLDAFANMLGLLVALVAYSWRHPLKI
jgi:VanZ family protein